MWPLRCSVPPYDNLETIDVDALSSIARGGVVVLDVDDPDRVDHAQLHRFTTGIRLRTDASIGIRLPRGGDPGVDARVVMHAYQCGIRAVLTEGTPLLPTLRDHLGNPPDVAGDLVMWLRLRHRVSDAAAGLAGRIVRDAPDFDDLGTLLNHMNIPPRTLRHRLDAGALPGPNRWFQLGRLIDAQLRLQRNPNLGVSEVALDLGYADRLSFTNRVYRVFGVTAEVSRGLLGLEWRFAAWWQRTWGSKHSCRQDLAVGNFDLERAT